jgi:hypothetical protein
VPAGSRVTIDLNGYLAFQYVPTPVDYSFTVASDQPLVAERILYFRTGLSGGADGATDVIGDTG